MGKVTKEILSRKSLEWVAIEGDSPVDEKDFSLLNFS
jgi:hypothetical protein